jgi:hypothetical protein
MGRGFTGEGVCGSFGGLRQKVWMAKELGGWVWLEHLYSLKILLTPAKPGWWKKTYIKLSNSKNFKSVSKLKIKQSQFSIQKSKLKIQQSPFHFRNLNWKSNSRLLNCWNQFRNLNWKSIAHHFNSEFWLGNQTVSISIQKSNLENKQLAFQFRTLTWTYNNIFFTFQILILIWFTIWHN